MEIDMSGHMYVFYFYIFFFLFFFFVFLLAMVPDGVLVQIIGFSEQDKTASYVTNKGRKEKVQSCMTFKA